MANRDLKKDLALVQSLKPQVLTTNNTTVVGGAIDLIGYDAVLVEANVGTWADTTTGGWEIGIQHSDDTVSGNFVDVPNAELVGYVTGDNTTAGSQATGIFAKIDANTEDDLIYTGGYIGGKRYIRHKLSAEGNQSTGTPIGITVIKGAAAVKPVTNN